VAALLPALLLSGASSIEVRVSEQGLRLSAQAAPLVEVLAELARHTGMRVLYEGAPPQNLISVDLQAKTPAEGLLELIEGLGLNYAAALDGRRGAIRTLLLIGAATGTGPPIPPTAPSPSIVPRAVPVQGEGEASDPASPPEAGEADAAVEPPLPELPEESLREIQELQRRRAAEIRKTARPRKDKPKAEGAPKSR
jgi:hypothetical protein